MRWTWCAAPVGRSPRLSTPAEYSACQTHSGGSIDSSRARWTTQGPFGWRVTPASRTWRVPSRMPTSRRAMR